MNVMKLAKIWSILLGVAMLSLSLAQNPGTGAHPQAQAAADVIREFTAADIAFLPAALIKDAAHEKEAIHEDLAALISYPHERVVVVNLTGAQIRRALERSISLYPLANVGFLQVSGLDVSFRRDASNDARVTSITCFGVKLEDARTYGVAMPVSLQRGQLGYQDLWETAKIARNYDKTTLFDILKGKHGSDVAPRWHAPG
jgi:2',3'-cyclic-nucleotide 2'-phosphodiesterase (5'-nucleotidase family)